MGAWTAPASDPADSAAVMDLRLLGPLALRDADGATVELGGPRPRALLALLALEAPAVVAADRIVESVWGDRDIGSHEASLYSTMSRLRGSIGADLIVTVPQGYRLDLPAGAIDVLRFRTQRRHGDQLWTLGEPAKAGEAYRRAVAEWSGPALTDLRQFEFAEQAARRLDDERIGAVESLMAVMLDEGRHDQVATELRGLVRDYPFRERLWELWMLSLYRAGRQAEALAAYRDLKQRLLDELGVDPGPALVDLERRILLHDRSLGARSPEAPAGSGSDVQYLDVDAGAVVVEQGAPATAVYWIEEGEVEVGQDDGSGGLLHAARLGPGGHFGELACLFGTDHPATVRAVVATTLSVHDLRSLRARMATASESVPRSEDVVDRLRDLLARGHLLEANDLATSEIARGDPSPEIRYLAVLALARSGATDQARRRYEQYGLARLAGPATSQLAGDVGALAARLDKDTALAAQGEERRGWARRSARAYGELFDASHQDYHAVNAATMWLVAGDRERAERLADAALHGAKRDADPYWTAATEAEAALVLGDRELAHHALVRADAASRGALSRRATTLRQLRLICRIQGWDDIVLDPLRNRPVLHYTGHRLVGGSGEDRVDGADVSRRVDAALDAIDPVVGFGSLAAGTDILVAEALLDRGADLNVVLPFERDEFVRTSVSPAGADWVQRFDRCLGLASSVEVATGSEYLDEPVLFDFCARIAMGRALIRAQHLESEAHQLAVWDGEDPSGLAGTAHDVSRWRASGSASTVVELGRTAGDDGPVLSARRRVRAVVVADVDGRWDLTDGEHDAVHRLLCEALEERRGRYEGHVVCSSLLGGRLCVVFDDVGVAARFGVDLRSWAASRAHDGRVPPRVRGLRVTAHAAPLFEASDPLSGAPTVHGAGVTEALLVAARTPPGELHATPAFTALAVLDGPAELTCRYVGAVATTVGPRALYALRGRDEHG